MVDDCHERSLNTDLVLGLLRKIRRKRQDLKIIVASATMNIQLFQTFFQEKDQQGTISTVAISGRCFPVEVFYLQFPTCDYIR